MGGWNHRVIRHENDMKSPWWSEEPYWYGIHEVYYDKDDKPEMCTQEPISVIATSEEELKWTLKKMSEATEKPVLDFNHFSKKE